MLQAENIKRARCSQVVLSKLLAAHEANCLSLFMLPKKSQCLACSRMLAKTIRHPLHTYLHPKISNEAGFGHRQPRLITYATLTSLLRSLVASQQLSSPSPIYKPLFKCIEMDLIYYDILNGSSLQSNGQIQVSRLLRQGSLSGRNVEVHVSGCLRHRTSGLVQIRSLPVIRTLLDINLELLYEKLILIKVARLDFFGGIPPKFEH